MNSRDFEREDLSKEELRKLRKKYPELAMREKLNKEADKLFKQAEQEDEFAYGYDEKNIPEL